MLGRKLAWLLLLFVPVIVFSARKIGMRVRHTTRSGQDKLADIQNILHETITGNRVVKAFSMEAWELTRFRTSRAASISRQHAFGGCSRNQFAADGHFRRGRDCTSSVVWPRADRSWLDDGGRSSLPSSSRCSSSTTRFASLPSFTTISSRPRCLVGDFQVHGRDATRCRKSPTLPLYCRSPETSAFADVSFCYESEGVQREVLRNINMEVKAGEILALVGSSGAGKSTLVSLIPRFFDVTTGKHHRSTKKTSAMFLWRRSVRRSA